MGNSRTARRGSRSRLPGERIALLVGVALVALAGCSGGAAPTEPDPGAEPVPASEGLSVPCSFLTSADLATAMGWDAADTEEFGGWVETDLGAGTACSWQNDEFTVTVQVFTGREATYAGITERTEDIMVGHQARRATRDAVGLISSVWIEAGLDYVVQVSQEPTLLVEEPFGELAYTAALAFENSSLNVG